MKVLIYEINKDKKTHFFGLKNAETGDVLSCCPLYKTIAGIVNWAFRNGYIVKDIED